MRRMGDLADYRAHLERYWPAAPHDEIASRHARTEQALPGLRVREIAPLSAGQPWIYVTVGASQAHDPEDDALGSEFVVLSPARDAVVPEMLAATAVVNAERDSRLRVGATIALPRPWIAGSAADHLLVTLPYAFGPSFELLELAGGARRIQTLWLVPITRSEAALVSAEGHGALEQRIERARANVAAAHRPPVA